MVFVWIASAVLLKMLWYSILRHWHWISTGHGILHKCTSWTCLPICVCVECFCSPPEKTFKAYAQKTFTYSYDATTRLTGSCNKSHGDVTLAEQINGNLRSCCNYVYWNWMNTSMKRSIESAVWCIWYRSLAVHAWSPIPSPYYFQFKGIRHKCGCFWGVVHMQWNGLQPTFQNTTAHWCVCFPFPHLIYQIKVVQCAYCICTYMSTRVCIQCFCVYTAFRWMHDIVCFSAIVNMLLCMVKQAWCRQAYICAYLESKSNAVDLHVYVCALNWYCARTALDLPFTHRNRTWTCIHGFVSSNSHLVYCAYKCIHVQILPTAERPDIIVWIYGAL